jgi:hypothetical protein
MYTPQSCLNPVVALGLLLNLVTFAIPATAAPVMVQTEATARNAAAGESGATIASSALIGVLVTSVDGKPVSTLGANLGNGTGAITLPSGWALITGAVPPSGCLMNPTQFSNQGNGIYSIRVVPFLNNPNCRWRSGDYLYTVRVGTATQDGSALGKLTIR